MYTKEFTFSVLVVDDEPFVLRTTAAILSNMGFNHILTADSAALAKKAIQESTPPVGLVLSDLNMPGVDGVELLRDYDEMGYKNDLVLMSGENEQTLQLTKTLAEARGLKVIGALSKPISSTLLSEMLANNFTNLSTRHPTKNEYPHITSEALKLAIEERELEPWFQPKIDIKSKEPVGVEALARWQKNAEQPIYPDQFIPIAESNGLINPLTFLMVEQALEISKQWRSRNLNLTIAVNVSMDTLYTPNFPDILDQCLVNAGGNCDWLNIEVTESRLMGDIIAPLETLLRLRLKKIKLSIDDFGTGHSNITQLRDLPFDELKLDRSFVQAAMHSDRAKKILESSIDMAKKLNMSIVAEGVETFAEWQLVESLGCDLVQGYWIAKPMPGDQIPEWVESWRKRRLELFNLPIANC